MKKTRVGVLISGRGSNLRALIEACKAPDYPAEIVLVVSNVPRAQGLAHAETASIPTRAVNHKDFASRDAFDAALTEALEEAQVELLCNAGFMRLHTEDFVRRWWNRHLNIHPSLLPAFPGLNTHARVLESGVKISGCTVHFVRPEMDTGPIVAQAAVPVLADDTEERLAARVLAAEHRLYPHALRLVASGEVRSRRRDCRGVDRSQGESSARSAFLAVPRRRALIESINGRKIERWTGRHVAPQNRCRPLMDIASGRMLETGPIQGSFAPVLLAKGRFFDHGGRNSETGQRPPVPTAGSLGEGIKWRI